MMKNLRSSLKLIAVGWVLLCSVGAWNVQAQDTRPAPTTQPATMPSAGDVAAKLMEQMETNPVVPAKRPAIESIDGVTSATGINAEVLGVAPGGLPIKLYREGEFIVSRKGRLVRTSHSAQAMFVFEADSEQAPEPPMIMVPCQMLESIEDLIHERGDKLVFILSGQVLMYRNANYLLPTMMKLAIDRGNLGN